MLKNNMNIKYALLLSMSMRKKSFTELGSLIRRSGVTVKRLLNSQSKNFVILEAIAQSLFKKEEALILSIDDTLLKKVFSEKMEGTCSFFDTQTNKKITAYKALVGGLTDGKYFIPIHSGFVFSKEIFEGANEAKDELIKKIITLAIQQYPKKVLTIVVDGAFATKKFFHWAIVNNIRLETRMHSNRTVVYKDETKKIRDIKNLQPKGRHKARTIQAVWHDMTLYITAEKRIDKHGEKSIVYQASTYKAKPSKHVINYKRRWTIEKFFRTGKQNLGLQDCYSTKLEIQESHLSSVLLSYALLQIEMMKQKLKCTEYAIRSFKSQNIDRLINRFNAMDEIFGDLHV